MGLVGTVGCALPTPAFTTWARCHLCTALPANAKLLASAPGAETSESAFGKPARGSPRATLFLVSILGPFLLLRIASDRGNQDKCLSALKRRVAASACGRCFINTNQSSSLPERQGDQRSQSRQPPVCSRRPEGTRGVECLRSSVSRRLMRADTANAAESIALLLAPSRGRAAGRAARSAPGTDVLVSSRGGSCMAASRQLL